jgi:hypothetical protein
VDLVAGEQVEVALQVRRVPPPIQESGELFQRGRERPVVAVVLHQVEVVGEGTVHRFTKAHEQAHLRIEFGDARGGLR